MEKLPTINSNLVNGLMRRIGEYSCGTTATNGTIDVASIYPKFNSLTNSNFTQAMHSVGASGDIGEHGHGSTSGVSLSYNASNGQLTWSYTPNYYGWAGAGISSVRGSIYLIYP